MKIFLYFTLIVFSCSVNGRICASSDSFIKLYTKQETDQNCLPDFKFSMDWWAQLGVNHFYVFVNRQEFLPDKFSCLDRSIASSCAVRALQFLVHKRTSLSSYPKPKNLKSP